MTLKILIFSAMVLAMSETASAQIIAQSPRPDVTAQPETGVETLTRKERVGVSGTLMKIPRTGALLFAGFDRNSDYVIDKNEVAQGIARAFKTADKDGSGVLSLVELEAWRHAALGSPHAAPGNYAFAPNFARTVSKKTFKHVLIDVAERLDKDDQGEMDGKIAMGDLLKDYKIPRAGKKGDNCAARLREQRRQLEQQCQMRR